MGQRKEVQAVSKIEGEFVTISGGTYTEYIRFAGGSWLVNMGGSWEQKYSVDDIEEAYQQYKNQVIG